MTPVRELAVSRRSRNRRQERDANVVAMPELDRLLLPDRPLLPVSLPSARALAVSDALEVEDLRRFSFNPPEASAVRSDGVPARVVGGAAPRTTPVVRPPRSPPEAVRFSFDDPRSVMVCARRKERREVLHALKRTRAGRGAKRRRKPYTDVRC